MNEMNNNYNIFRFKELYISLIINFYIKNNGKK